jgi:CheY-like chemotaxis protein
LKNRKPFNSRPSRHTVLVVEDDVDMLVLCRHWLQWAGYTVLEARSSVEALRLVQTYAGAIHVLLTDLMLPPVFDPKDPLGPSLRLNGDELARRLKALRKDIQTILMSAYTDEALSSLCILPSNAQFLRKPFDQLTLLAAVGDAIGAFSEEG